MMLKESIVERLCSDLDRKEPRYKSPTLLYSLRYSDEYSSSKPLVSGSPTRTSFTILTQQSDACTYQRVLSYVDHNQRSVVLENFLQSFGAGVGYATLLQVQCYIQPLISPSSSFSIASHITQV